MTSFEDDLWARLVDEHGADSVTLTAPRSHGGRRPLAIGGGLTAVAVATAAAVLAIDVTTATTPAYAMTQNTDGTYTVTINEIANAIPALNAKFAQLGIEETVVPVTGNCTSNTLPLDVGPDNMSDTVTLAPGGKYLSPGETGVLAAEQLPDGRVAMFMGAVQPPVPACLSAAELGHGMPSAVTISPTPTATGTQTATTPDGRGTSDTGTQSTSTSAG